MADTGDLKSLAKYLAYGFECGDDTMKRLTLVSVLIGVLKIYGNTVEWGSFALVDIGGAPTIGYVGSTLHTDTSVSLGLTRSGDKLIISESGYTSLVSFSYWTLAYASEIIGSEMFEDVSRVYLWKCGQTGESFDVNASSDSFYLAYKTLLWKDEEFTTKDGMTYGWVHVGVQGGNLTLLDSAISLDKSPLCVGGGSIPEPSSGLLVLMGFAVLSLKRKSGGTPYGRLGVSPQ